MRSFISRTSVLTLSRRQSAWLKPLAVRGEAGRVVEVLARLRVRVEEVVEVHAVDVVLRHRLQHRVLDEASRLGDAGVEVEPARPGADRDRRPPTRGGRAAGGSGASWFDVGAGATHRRRLGAPVRVHPGVELEVAGVRLGDHELHRVPARDRRRRACRSATPTRARTATARARRRWAGRGRRSRCGCSRWARSSQPRYSALTVSVSSPGWLGQSMLLTVVSHMPRSWRGASTGRPPHVPSSPTVIG